MSTSIWKNKNFTMLYFGQLFSVFGDWIKTVTLIAFIYYITNDARTTGLLFVLVIIPQIVVSFFAGPLIDKYNKKTFNHIFRYGKICIRISTRLCSLH